MLVAQDNSCGETARSRNRRVAEFWVHRRGIGADRSCEKGSCRDSGQNGHTTITGRPTVELYRRIDWIGCHVPASPV